MLCHVKADVYSNVRFFLILPTFSGHIGFFGLTIYMATHPSAYITNHVYPQPVIISNREILDVFCFSVFLQCRYSFDDARIVSHPTTLFHSKLGAEHARGSTRMWTLYPVFDMSTYRGNGIAWPIHRVLVEKKCMVSQDALYQIFATSSSFYVPLFLILLLYWKIFKVSKRIDRFKAASQRWYDTR